MENVISSCDPMYRARQKNGSEVARIFQARPGRSGKQRREQNSPNLGTVFLPGPVVRLHDLEKSNEWGREAGWVHAAALN